jgi:hypothetical protein
MGVLRVRPFNPPAQPPLEGVAVGVHEARRQGPAREAFPFWGGPYLDHASILDRDAHAGAGPAGVEEEVGYEGAPQPSREGMFMPKVRAAALAAS